MFPMSWCLLVGEWDLLEARNPCSRLRFQTGARVHNFIDLSRNRFPKANSEELLTYYHVKQQCNSLIAQN